MSNDFYIISTHSYIKNVSKYLDIDFLKELKTNSNELKPHVKDLNINEDIAEQNVTIFESMTESQEIMNKRIKEGFSRKFSHDVSQNKVENNKV